MIKFYKTPESSFSTGMGLNFCIFLATRKKSKTFYIYRQTTRQRDDQTDKKETFLRTNTLQPYPMNQVDNNCFLRGCFDANLSTIASSPNF